MTDERQDQPTRRMHISEILEQKPTGPQTQEQLLDTFRTANRALAEMILRLRREGRRPHQIEEDHEVERMGEIVDGYGADLVEHWKSQGEKTPRKL